MDAPYAVVWLHRVSCGSSLFGSQEKSSFICSCHWAQMHSESAKSGKKMEMFIFKYKGCLRFTGRQRNEAENAPAGPLKTPRIRVIHKHWFLTCWCLAPGSGGGSDQLYSFYDVRESWRLDICWMTGSCAPFSSGFFQSFLLYCQRWNDSYLLVHQVLPCM